MLPLQKPHTFTWYGANMYYIQDKIPNLWQCENSMLIWYLFNKCGWLEKHKVSIILNQHHSKQLMKNLWKKGEPMIDGNHGKNKVLTPISMKNLMSSKYVTAVFC